MLKTITINTDTHKVVPLEPTEEMEGAGRYSRDCPVSGSDKPEDIYKAMLAAAPEYKHLLLPIETAPKDGTPILLCTADGIVEAQWERRKWEQSPCYSTYEGCGAAEIGCKPTHWMPLPTAPEGV